MLNEDIRRRITGQSGDEGKKKIPDYDSYKKLKVANMYELTVSVDEMFAHSEGIMDRPVEP